MELTYYLELTEHADHSEHTEYGELTVQQAAGLTKLVEGGRRPNRWEDPHPLAGFDPQAHGARFVE